MATTPTRAARSIADLTRSIFGEALSIDEVFTRIDAIGIPVKLNDPAALMWVGSVGYERHKNHRDFAEHLRINGIERLIDVRELPISRRRGYAKTALSGAMNDVGIEYVHMKALGNPKPLRDMYKSGRVSEGREAYTRFLLAERRDALDALVPLLHDKRSALMCVEHDASTCHRSVILDALRGELGLGLDVSEVL